MKNEIKRALFKKSNLILVAAIFGLMFLNAYYSGLKTALTVNASSDLRNMEDVIFTKKYYGNMYRVWKNAYYLTQALAPIFLAAPYLNTYLSEKTGHFRYFCTCRKGNRKYALQKEFAVALSGTVVLSFAELLFAVISALLTERDLSLEYMEGIVSYKEDFFLRSPFLYFALIFVSHLVYYFFFTIFSLGITSFLKNKIAVLVTPFVAATVMDVILPAALRPNVVMRPYNRSFSPFGFLLLICLYGIIGHVALMMSERIYLKKGNDKG
ncbi:MAG: hypothetical protein LUC90_09075 [Lachnospiraceae bacterium]|nr:hypothetical protein [Lachnospiraceae bacterium]